MVVSEQNRIYSIDALRGVAVIFMIVQHVIFWLCSAPRGSTGIRIAGAIGGIAAPLFIALAGLGVALACGRYENTTRMFVLRGLAIIGFGYLLNIIASSWFSPISWYILHMIGFALIISPLLAGRSSRLLILMIVLCIIAAAIVQYRLNTPLRLYNKQMAQSGGVLLAAKFAFAEGYFPVFPWMSFFISGMLAGGWIIKGQLKKIVYLAISFLVAALFLSGFYFSGLSFAHHKVLERFFKFVPTFYPSLAPMTLLLLSIALVMIVLFIYLNPKIVLSSTHPLVCLGRSSLTIFLAHIILIRESAVRLHYWRSLSLPWAYIAAVLIIVAFAFFSMAWQKINYRYGAEWLVRKIPA